VFKLTIFIFMVIISPTAVHSSPCSTDILPPIASIDPSALLRQILMGVRLRDHQNEPMVFSADEITIENDIITMSEPRLNGLRISYLELYCTSFGTSFFGTEICLESSSRSIEQALCTTLGLEPAAAEYTLVNNRQNRNVFFYTDNRWRSDSTRLPGNPNYEFQALLRFSCRL
jgi:hypothetical protein